MAANRVPKNVLRLIFFSGFLISPPEIAALSRPINDQRVTAIADGRLPILVTSGEEYVLKYSGLKPIKAIIINTKMTPSFKTVVITLI